jgi:ABC-2 type transport system permease protein
VITAIRVELLKFLTVRISLGLFAAAVALNGLVASVTSSQAGVTGGSILVPSLATADGLKMVLTSTGFSLVIALVCGVVIVTSEFRNQTITDTYLDDPHRVRVLLAKIVAAVVIGFVIGLVAGGVTAAIGLGFTAAKGFSIALATSTIGGYILGNATAAALLAAIGVGVGALIRSQVAAIIAVFVWSFGIEQVIASTSSSLAPYLPYTAAATMAGARGGQGMPQLPIGLDALPFAASAGVLAALVVVFFAIDAHTTVRKDVS